MNDRIVVLHLRSSVASGGGPEKTIYNTGRFIDQQHFLYLVAYLTKIKQPSVVVQKGIGEGLHYFQLPGSSCFDQQQLQGIVQLIKKYSVQILHCHDPKTDFYGLLLKIIFPKIKLISTMHGWIKRRRRSIFYNTLDMFLLRWFNAIIAVSRDVERIAKGHGIKNALVIYNAIDTVEWQPGYPASPFLPIKKTESFVVGYVGRISMEKGPLDFVNVAHKLLLQDNTFEFVVAGEGPELETMKTQVTHMNIMNHFHFLGQVGIENMPAVYQAFDVLLTTSFTEGLPNSILEAFAMRIPVVATDVGGVGEIITHNMNGLLVKPGDISGMVDSILLIRSNRDIAHRFAKSGRNTIEKQFSFENHVKSLEKLYIQLLA